eukprot:XP_011676908.1 PREDICTED: uncharacterized protein LOC105444399 [Strongylocentrotus purpuratus]
MRRCGEEAIAWINKSFENEQEKMGLLTETLAQLPDEKRKAEEYVELATHLVGLGMTALGELRYKECFRFMKECYFPIQEAARTCKNDPVIMSEVEVLQEDVHQHTCLAEAGKARATGSGNMFKADTEKNPSTTLSSFSRARGNAFFRLARGQRFDMVKSISYKSALACYKKAYNWASRDEDLVSAAENAATTCWRLATLKMATECASYQKVIHEYFKDALQYFGKAYPKRNCKGEKWAKHLEKSIQECLHEIRTWIELKDEDGIIYICLYFVLNYI